jgi:AbrB family looped-hinge helix DNA binding protein
METVTVLKKYQVVIPEKLRKSAGIKPGDKMVAITNMESSSTSPYAL